MRYAPAPGFFDELFDADGQPRGAAEGLTGALERLGRERLQSAGDVAPIRGVYKGTAGTEGHDVSVKMTRLG